jgi:hypothetical protein
MIAGGETRPIGIFSRPDHAQSPTGSDMMIEMLTSAIDSLVEVSAALVRETAELKDRLEAKGDDDRRG